MSDIKHKFGGLVRQKRQSLGLTQEEFAKRCGLHRTYISGIERGTRNVALANIEKIARALDIGLGKLFKDLN
jgi:transcriptional regulator with XRE-family HTH domain